MKRGTRRRQSNLRESANGSVRLGNVPPASVYELFFLKKGRCTWCRSYLHMSRRRFTRTCPPPLPPLLKVRLKPILSPSYQPRLQFSLRQTRFELRLHRRCRGERAGPRSSAPSGVVKQTQTLNCAVSKAAFRKFHHLILKNPPSRGTKTSIRAITPHLMWESPPSLVPSPLYQIPLFLSLLSSQIPLFSLCSPRPKSSSFPPPTPLISLSPMNQRSHSLRLSLLFGGASRGLSSKRKRKNNTRVNRKYERFDIPNFVWCCAPKQKKKR